MFTALMANTHLLYDPLLIHSRRQILKVHRPVDRLAQTRDKLDVDVRFNERVAYLLDHAIESL